MQGWIKLHRKLSDNPLWQCERFTRGQAWIDLILLTNHEDGYFYKRGVKIIVNRGQCAWSELALSKRWQWSRNKVRKFLKDLEKEHQIKQQKNNVTQVITINNYEKYQEKGHQKDTKRTPEGHQKDTNKNDKKEKNEKNINILFSEFWDLYDKKIGDKKSCKKKWNKLKDEEREKIISTLPEWKKQFSEKQFQPYPATYLNQERWNDEIVKGGSYSQLEV